MGESTNYINFGCLIARFDLPDGTSIHAYPQLHPHDCLVYTVYNQLYVLNSNAIGSPTKNGIFPGFHRVFSMIPSDSHHFLHIFARTSGRFSGFPPFSEPRSELPGPSRRSRPWPECPCPAQRRPPRSAAWAAPGSEASPGNPRGFRNELPGLVNVYIMERSTILNGEINYIITSI